ncbi:MAG: preprotein translocase subunit SecA [Planctomycetota bacterium]
MSFISKLLVKVFGSRNERVVKALHPVVAEIASHEDALQGLSDEQLRGKTGEFRQRLDNGEALDNLLPEAFACVRESSRRHLKTATGVAMRHFDVQMMGGVVLHRGGIAEMVTGEGKTLVATLPAYLNALPAKGVHVVTVNDYLARRDAEWMTPVYEGLGMSVGAIQSNMDSQERITEYNCDITYGTNNEFGFDYLRDNMKIHPQDQCQRHRHFAIVDEVDSILVDEARTPLIISGPSEESTGKYFEADKVARKLERDRHFEVKEKEQGCVLTEEGIERGEQLAGVDSFYSPANMQWPHMIEQALRAHHVYSRDVDYVVNDTGVVIVDEFTGRLMEGRRWGDGLHQAVEAKEGIRIREESQTLASITFQNFFRLYDGLGGMTGTAMTEAVEFDTIYKLDVVAIPTNRELVRQDCSDVVYRTRPEKWKAICERVMEVHKEGRPALVGTISIENSELLSEMLKRRGVPHSVLNAKYHEQEAEIISQAGQHGAVTIATNMAGRGTDIVLGDGVKELGGLYVLGTERHESRRIDNQLRGRCGRQGDPGTTEFFLCLEDDLMRLFATERVSSILKRFGMTEGVEISHPMVSRAIERAQKKVEARNFDIRKNLLEYDEVMDQQRKMIYDLRNRILHVEDLKGLVLEFFGEVAENTVAGLIPDDPDRADQAPDAVAGWLRDRYGFDLGTGDWAVGTRKMAGALVDRAVELYGQRIDEKYQKAGPDFERVLHYILLQGVDDKWKDHLHAMDQLRAGIGLRSYAQVDPKIEYKREGYAMFQMMMAGLKEDTTAIIPRVEMRIDADEAERNLESNWQRSSMNTEQLESQFNQHSQRMQQGIEGSQNKGTQVAEPIRNVEDKVGRNDPCTCGSGKKYKKCCGRGQ